METYQPRPIDFLKLLTPGEWRIKLYGISFDGGGVDLADFNGGIDLALAALPLQAKATDRPGVGFAIAHRGAGVDYTVLGWWDRSNELPLRVFVRETGQPWRAAVGGESVCVWDLQVITHERDAYVAYMMRGDEPDVAGYLADVGVTQSASESAL